MKESRKSAVTLPCRHALDVDAIGKVKGLLADLPTTAPEVVAGAGVDPADWDILLRAAVESIRGTNSATTSDKRQFIAAILEYGKTRGVFTDWSFIGSTGRQDYRVELPNRTSIGVEAKGCPDGNNTTIWDRPSWADEFVVWFLCPESLAHPAGEGLWSGIAIRLMNKIVAEHQVVDTVMYFDGRCGSEMRQCPKDHGVSGELRAEATSIVGQAGAEDVLPPPCIYLMPRSYPSIPSNPKPPLRRLSQSAFARAMLALFNVPDAEQGDYVHEASVEAQGTAGGTKIQVSVTSRCWPDGEPRHYQSKFKPVKRE
jgi:hypothetical protein